MSRPLVIVESPAKAKTIARHLGGGYDVRASIGHIADLPTKGLGVDVDNGFQPQWELTSRGKDVVKELRALLKDASRAVPGHGRGPRGRDHLVAPPAAPEAQGAGEADGVPRDHPVGDQRRRRQSARPRRGPGRRGRDSSDPRSARTAGRCHRCCGGGSTAAWPPGGSRAPPPASSSSVNVTGWRSSPRPTGTSRPSWPPSPSFTATLATVRRDQGGDGQGLR